MLNDLSIMGRLTTDPEHKQTPSGVSVTTFAIAVERNYVNESTKKRDADFINIVAWRNTADFICKHFVKGKPILINGYLQSRTYEDKNGIKRAVVEVVAEKVFFAGDLKDNSMLIPPPAEEPPVSDERTE